MQLIPDRSALNLSLPLIIGVVFGVGFLYTALILILAHFRTCFSRLSAVFRHLSAENCSSGSSEDLTKAKTHS